MTITQGTVTSSINEGSTGETVACDVGAATNRAILVFALRGTNQTVDTLTYAGVNILTGAVAGATATNGSAHVDTYFAIPSATGSNNVVSVLSGAGNHGLICIPLSADGELSTADGTSAIGSSSPVSVTVSSAAGRLIYDAFYMTHSGGGSTTTMDASQTLVKDHENYNGASSAGSSREAGGASVAMTWTATNVDAWAQAALSIVEAASASGTAGGMTSGGRLKRGILRGSLIG